METAYSGLISVSLLITPLTFTGLDITQLGDGLLLLTGLVIYQAVVVVDNSGLLNCVIFVSDREVQICCVMLSDLFLFFRGKD